MENPLVSVLHFAKNTTYEGILDVPFYSLQVFFYIDDKSPRMRRKKNPRMEGKRKRIVYYKSEKKRKKIDTRKREKERMSEGTAEGAVIEDR